ncbi:MAG: MBL fold metallo-hydrolase [Pseudomonadota bacterium]
MRRLIWVQHLAMLLLLSLCGWAIADDHEDDETPADPMANVEIKSSEVRDGIYMLTGRGGNIGLATGNEATFIVDDQYAPLTERIVAAIAGITDRPVDYILNTHWHFDHTGGNENFGERGAIILAHDNVRKRMATGQYMKAFDMQIEPSPDVALPVITFDSKLTLHVNDQTIRGIHVHHAHTDGDTIVVFEEANVMHLGDTYFNGLYPFIDLESGGSVDGMIRSAAKVLEMTNEDTLIIPGHGPLSTPAELQSYHDMLKGIRDNVAALIAEGKSLEDVVAAKPSAAFDETANRFGFLTPDQFTTTVFTSLTMDASQQ